MHRTSYVQYCISARISLQGQAKMLHAVKLRTIRRASEDGPTAHARSRVIPLVADAESVCKGFKRLHLLADRQPVNHGQNLGQGETPAEGWGRAEEASNGPDETHKKRDPFKHPAAAGMTPFLLLREVRDS